MTHNNNDTEPDARRPRGTESDTVMVLLRTVLILLHTCHPGTPVSHPGTPVSHPGTPVSHPGTPVSHHGTPVKIQKWRAPLHHFSALHLAADQHLSARQHHPVDKHLPADQHLPSVSGRAQMTEQARTILPPTPNRVKRLVKTINLHGGKRRKKKGKKKRIKQKRRGRKRMRQLKGGDSKHKQRRRVKEALSIVPWTPGHPGNLTLPHSSTLSHSPASITPLDPKKSELVELVTGSKYHFLLQATRAPMLANHSWKDPSGEMSLLSTEDSSQFLIPLDIANSESLKWLPYNPDIRVSIHVVGEGVGDEVRTPLPPRAQDHPNSRHHNHHQQQNTIQGWTRNTEDEEPGDGRLMSVTTEHPLTRHPMSTAHPLIQHPIVKKWNPIKMEQPQHHSEDARPGDEGTQHHGDGMKPRDGGSRHHGEGNRTRGGASQHHGDGTRLRGRGPQKKKKRKKLANITKVKIKEKKIGDNDRMNKKSINTQSEDRRSVRKQGKIQDEKEKRGKEGRRRGEERQTGSTQDLVLGLAEALEQILSTDQQDLQPTSHHTAAGGDPCTAWSTCRVEEALQELASLETLPSCPCLYPADLPYQHHIYDPIHHTHFRWVGVSSQRERIDVYHRGAQHCIRSHVTSASLAAQTCCYDRERQLLTRGSGAGSPTLASPEVNFALHWQVDILPWLACRGNFLRYQAVRPPNNGQTCPTNPGDLKYHQQVNMATDY